MDKIEPESYSVKTLHQWKDRREKGRISELNGLRNFTEERLQEMIEDAMEEQSERIEVALSRLAVIDVEAAEILRRTVEELGDMRRIGLFSLDPDIVGLLYESANKINLDPDTVSLLSVSAATLNNALNVDMLEKLNAAAGHLSGIVSNLQEALEQQRRGR
ncbi:MAG: hypothetical protein DLM60_03390 [Pseudonocardiales bacterium]|nr:MAG: hypothetical protein DLM60_03390 [Pseudonocardiales bacterium]